MDTLSASTPRQAGRPGAAPPRAKAAPGRLTAVLGPTNTGKTHFAMARMLAHESGIMGFPLRLLARENYDRAVAAKGAAAVALVTGEEKIVPPGARYFLCTVESMPADRPVEFLAIDEVQLAADPERGHIYTDRLLRQRGAAETMVIGAETARPLLRRILPEAEPVTRPRLSKLTYSGPKKITRLPRRSAVIGFSATEVYGLAELIRRRRGGTAVVLGALSPRTRNAQVGLFQSGDVDYLVATDAIGMGLNMDIDHVAFSRLSKFDGRMTRRLSPAEIGQIAGRAGRHMADGTFGTTTGALLDPDTIEAVEEHRFETLKFFYWRNAALDFASVEALLASLAAPPAEGPFVAARDAEDALTLAALSAQPETRARATSPAGVRLLWDACQIPDFRKIGPDAHARLVGRIHADLSRPKGRLDGDWLARQVARIDKAEGDIGTLVGRIAEIRTFTYVAYRPDWLDDCRHWQERTRAVEDRLSDALHERLTERFVDKRTAVLVRRLGQRDELIGGVDAQGEVTVEGVPVGRLEGFRFAAAPAAGQEDARALRAAAERALRPALADAVSRLDAADDDALALDDEGRIAWNGVPVGALTRGGSALAPSVRPLVDLALDAPQRERIRARLSAWIDGRIRRRLGALAAPPPAGLSGAGRGLLFQLGEALGLVPRAQVATLLGGLSAADRRLLAQRGVRLGTETVFVAPHFNAEAMRLKARLWIVFAGRDAAPAPKLPPGPKSWLARAAGWPAEFYRALGYVPFETKAVRADRLEALAQAARRLAQQGGFALTPALTGALGAPDAVATEALEALGYRFTDDGSGGAFRATGALKRARSRPASEPANPCSPFAGLRALTGRP
jgi:ATP-dependent RNA helicase SUPV3L1/SUV3